MDLAREPESLVFDASASAPLPDQMECSAGCNAGTYVTRDVGVVAADQLGFSADGDSEERQHNQINPEPDQEDHMRFARDDSRHILQNLLETGVRSGKPGQVCRGHWDIRLLSCRRSRWLGHQRHLLWTEQRHPLANEAAVAFRQSATATRVS